MRRDLDQGPRRPFSPLLFRRLRPTAPRRASRPASHGARPRPIARRQVRGAEEMEEGAVVEGGPAARRPFHSRSFLHQPPQSPRRGLTRRRRPRPCRRPGCWSRWRRPPPVPLLAGARCGSTPRATTPTPPSPPRWPCGRRPPRAPARPRGAASRRAPRARRLGRARRPPRPRRRPGRGLRRTRRASMGVCHRRRGWRGRCLAEERGGWRSRRSRLRCLPLPPLLPPARPLCRWR